jgi:hypothetical protein
VDETFRVRFTTTPELSIAEDSWLASGHFPGK